MKYFDIVIKVVMLAAIIFAIWSTWTASKMKNINRPQAGARMTLEQKLARLEECGFKLADPFTVHDLLQSWDRAEYEKPGWEAVLTGLAITEEQEPWRPHCANLYLIDTECIEDHGDYKTIAEELVRIAQGSLPLDNIKDFVEVDNGKAWLSFKYKGEETRIDCRVDDDWLDPDIFTVFKNVLEKADSSKTFVVDSFDQTIIIGCVTKTQAGKLKTLGTKLDHL